MWVAWRPHDIHTHAIGFEIGPGHIKVSVKKLRKNTTLLQHPSAYLTAQSLSLELSMKFSVPANHSSYN